MGLSNRNNGVGEKIRNVWMVWKGVGDVFRKLISFCVIEFIMVYKCNC